MLRPIHADCFSNLVFHFRSNSMLRSIHVRHFCLFQTLGELVPGFQDHTASLSLILDIPGRLSTFGRLRNFTFFRVWLFAPRGLHPKFCAYLHRSFVKVKIERGQRFEAHPCLVPHVCSRSKIPILWIVARVCIVPVDSDWRTVCNRGIVIDAAFVRTQTWAVERYTDLEAVADFSSFPAGTEGDFALECRRFF
jgi:hypothetical protein